jgi:hypothetical protein
VRTKNSNPYAGMHPVDEKRARDTIMVACTLLRQLGCAWEWDKESSTGCYVKTPGGNWLFASDWRDLWTLATECKNGDHG